MADTHITDVDERWKPVVGYEDLYQISSRGEVRSNDKVCPCCGSVTKKGIVLRPSVSRGYSYVSLCREGGQERKPVASIVCEAFHGPRPAGFQAAHRDGNRQNNSIDNLSWLHPVENAADKERHGTVLRGSNHQNSILNESDVLEIRRRLACGETEHPLAREYGVSRGAISSIRRRVTWAHI